MFKIITSSMKSEVTRSLEGIEDEYDIQDVNYQVLAYGTTVRYSVLVQYAERLVKVEEESNPHIYTYPASPPRGVQSAWP